ncbi:MAG: nucleotide exchange factor GrpE [Thermodesulfobacteriota bacterium]
MSDEKLSAQEAAAENAAGAPAELTLTDEELRALCAARVCPACPEKAEFDDQRLRQLAELDNTRKRLQREMDEFRKYAAEGVLADLLPVLDNLDLAIEHGGNDPASKNLLLGVEMTHKIFLDILAQHGLVAVGCEGEEFTPELHEAVGQEAHPDHAPGKVCKLLKKGYKLRERLLRPAMVMVSAEAQG